MDFIVEHLKLTKAAPVFTTTVEFCLSRPPRQADGMRYLWSDSSRTFPYPFIDRLTTKVGKSKMNITRGKAGHRPVRVMSARPE